MLGDVLYRTIGRYQTTMSRDNAETVVISLRAAETWGGGKESEKEYEG